MKNAQEVMKEYYDKKRNEAPSMKPGDRVWLNARNIMTSTPSKKLADKKLGPFKIKTRLSNLTYELELPKTYQIHPVFNVDLLIPYQESTITGRKSNPPPPVMIMGEEEYEVEEIIDARKWRNQK
jgi:hypothetical protein